MKKLLFVLTAAMLIGGGLEAASMADVTVRNTGTQPIIIRGKLIKPGEGAFFSFKRKYKKVQFEYFVENRTGEEYKKYQTKKINIHKKKSRTVFIAGALCKRQDWGRYKSTSHKATYSLDNIDEWPEEIKGYAKTP